MLYGLFGLSTSLIRKRLKKDDGFSYQEIKYSLVMSSFDSASSFCVKLLLKDKHAVKIEKTS